MQTGQERVSCVEHIFCIALAAYGALGQAAEQHL
jgi:hypothetical protein